MTRQASHGMSKKTPSVHRNTQHSVAWSAKFPIAQKLVLHRHKNSDVAGFYARARVHCLRKSIPSSLCVLIENEIARKPLQKHVHKHSSHLKSLCSFFCGEEERHINGQAAWPDQPGLARPSLALLLIITASERAMTAGPPG